MSSLKKLSHLLFVEGERNLFKNTFSCLEADPTAQDAQHFRTALHTAAMINDLELCQYARLGMDRLVTIIKMTSSSSGSGKLMLQYWFAWPGTRQLIANCIVLMMIGVLRAWISWQAILGDRKADPAEKWNRIRNLPEALYSYTAYDQHNSLLLQLMLPSSPMALATLSTAFMHRGRVKRSVAEPRYLCGPIPCRLTLLTWKRSRISRMVCCYVKLYSFSYEYLFKMLLYTYQPGEDGDVGMSFASGANPILLVPVTDIEKLSPLKVRTRRIRVMPSVTSAKDLDGQMRHRLL
nr:E3 ubiquitin-protein ligase KEG [Ipomoea batatas]